MSVQGRKNWLALRGNRNRKTSVMKLFVMLVVLSKQEVQFYQQPKKKKLNQSPHLVRKLIIIHRPFQLHMNTAQIIRRSWRFGNGRDISLGDGMNFSYVFCLIARKLCAEPLMKIHSTSVLELSVHILYLPNQNIYYKEQTVCFNINRDCSRMFFTDIS